MTVQFAKGVVLAILQLKMYVSFVVAELAATNHLPIRRIGNDLQIWRPTTN